MRQDYEQFVTRGAEILTVAPESEVTVATYWEKEDLPVVGLADADHAVAGRYGQPVRMLRLGRLPMQLLIDRDGIVRTRHAGGWMSDIPENAGVLQDLDDLGRA